MPLEKETFQKNAKLEGEVIVLDKNFVDKNVGNKFGFKKITGTRLACILGLNHYKTEFKCWMEMVKLYKEEIPKQLSVAGHNIEPLIRDFVASKCFEAEYTSVDPKTVY
jgi:predicted phage-related endonuclease